MTNTKAYQGYNVDGDLSVGHDIHVGGDSIIHGKAVFKGDVRVDGDINADNINVANKGLFSSFRALVAAYPYPHNGWWAIVGEAIPGIIYRVENRQWYNTGIIGGNINGNGNNAEFQEYVEDELEILKNAVFPINLSLSHDLGNSITEFTGLDQQIKITWSCSRQGKAFIPKSVHITKIVKGIPDEQILNISAISSSGYVSTYINSLGTTKFQCKIVTDDGVTKTSVLQIRQILPIYYGFCHNVSTLSDMQNNLTGLTEEAPVDISTTLSNGSSDNHLFVCLPNPVTLKTVSSEGFAVPMNDSVILNAKINNTSHQYNIYKSYNKIMPSNYNIQFTTN